MGYKILHVAAHYGGGVGSIINSWSGNDTGNTHILTYLNNRPENLGRGALLFKPWMVDDVDIVLCHIWNHPSMFEFLVESKLPPCRMIGWSHMSGLYEPYILFDRLVNYFDEFYYTSPVSNLTGIQCDYIWSVRDISDFLKLEKTPHDGFIIGYIGTLDYCKLHPKFLDICQSIDIPDVKFVVVGEGCDADEIKREAGHRGLDMKLTGLVKDIKPIISTFDVFLYPLYERHFGTCEQVLGEALATGLPCVVLANDAERFIIKNGKNGIICYSTSDIPEAIKGLYDEVITIDSNVARESASEKYSIETKIYKWNEAFNRIMCNDKRLHKWYDIFFESLGRQGDIIRRQLNYNDFMHIADTFNKNRQWKSESKGSIKQYLDYYPDDENIKKLAGLL